jgi:hypothetical protein
MRSCLTLGLTLCAALALAACTGETKKETGGKAGGEILPASVSDAMLPRDTVRSQAPLAPKAVSSEAGKNTKDPDQEVAASRPASAEPAAPAEPAE